MSKKTVIDKIVDSGLIMQDAVIIVGFSGGPDSLCLLHSLVQLSEYYNLTIVPVHINHMLRPSAEAEADNAVRICDRLDLECLCFEADCQAYAEDMKISTEEAGRDIRYDIFDDVAENIVEDGVEEDRIFIALAHNADDQSETVLFRLLRGTGPHGLAGMPQLRASQSGFMIIRPLLDVPRSDIEKYISSNRLHPNIDETNSGTDYARNRIRNELIPYLEKNYNPNIKQALRRYAELAEVDDSFIETIATGECSEAISFNAEDNCIYLDIEGIRENPPAVNSRIVSIIMKLLRLEGVSSYELVVAILGLIYSDNPSASIDMPNGYRAIREYDSILFTDNIEKIRKAETVSCNSLSLKAQIVLLKEFKPDPEDCYAAFDFDEFNKKYPGRIGEIQIRSRREGDYLVLKDGNRKKLQDFMVDSKIKKSMRNCLPIVCIDDEVLWILPDACLPGEAQKTKGRFSQNFHITDRTERVLFLEVSENM